MITIFVHSDGVTQQQERLDPNLLRPGSEAAVWVDLAGPTPGEARILTDAFHFHELAVEDALSQAHHPKIESYDNYLYLILHCIDFQASKHRFTTRDTDFFLGPNYLVTVHDGSIETVRQVRELCPRNDRILGEGPAALLHRLVDRLVDGYLPEVDELEAKIEELEKQVFERPRRNLVRQILALKRDVGSLRRVTLPQRDALARLARREFPQVPEPVTYRFRDVYDHLVRLVDESMAFQDRITSLLEAHLSNVSNQLNEVMKVLTVISTIFMPMTVLTGLYGMNVSLFRFPGGDALQFWWIVGLLAASTGLMLWLFHRSRWI